MNRLRFMLNYWFLSKVCPLFFLHQSIAMIDFIGYINELQIDNSIPDVIEYFNYYHYLLLFHLTISYFTTIFNY